MKTALTIVTTSAVVLLLYQATLRALYQSPTSTPAEKNNVELAQMYKDDQGDRTPDKIDWAVVGPRDRQRRPPSTAHRSTRATGRSRFHQRRSLPFGKLCLAGSLPGQRHAADLRHQHLSGRQHDRREDQVHSG